MATKNVTPHVNLTQLCNKLLLQAYLMILLSPS